ncbi:MAG: antibiotic biosynthesis monooxygenase [Actinomycetes bacterium]
MTENPATVITNTCVRPEHEAEFTQWQADMSRMISVFPGYVGGEVIPPYPPTQPDWVIVQRFDSTEHLKGWLDSQQRQDMVTRIQPLLVGDDAVNVFVGRDAQNSESSEAATAVIMTKVSSGSEEQFLAWQKRIDGVQSTFPGYIGCETQPPVEGFQDSWVTMLRFDSPKHLDDWLASPEREALVIDADTFVEKSEVRAARSGFATWFKFGAKDDSSAPPWKMNYIILLGLYPIVMLEIFFLNPYFDWLPISAGNFIGNVFSVGILGWPVVWALSRWMGWWLVPKGQSSKLRDWAGALVALISVAIMGWLFVLLHNAVQVTPVTEFQPGSSAMIPAYIYLVLTVIVFALWFSALGNKVGIWGGGGSDDDG